MRGEVPSGWRSPPVYRGRGPRSGEGVRNEASYSILIYSYLIYSSTKSPTYSPCDKVHSG